MKSPLQTPKARKANLTTFLNPYSYLIARKNLSKFSSFDNIYFDGIFLCRLMNLIGIKQNRVSFDMTSLAPKIFMYASEHNKSVYFIGGEEGVSKKAAETLKSSFPNLNIIGCRSGFFKGNEYETTLKEIVQAKPDIVVCGMGTPHQENFLLKLKEHSWSGEGFTCGGFFHQTAKSGVTYYPKLIDKLNLRWLYRMIDEPKLIKRYSTQYPLFLLVFMLDVLIYKNHLKLIKNNICRTEQSQIDLRPE